MLKNHPGGFGSMEGSWKAAEVWHCERPEINIGEDVDSVAFDCPGLKESCKRFEAWHHDRSL